MKKLTAVLVIGVAMLWATGAWAYSALDAEDPYMVTTAGAGMVVIMGDDSAGDSQTEAYPTVNLGGIYDWAAWQVFYAVDSDVTVFGGTLDYILVNNFDECAPCGPTAGSYWFGAGLSVISVADLFPVGGSESTSGTDSDDFGANLGLGYMWGDWTLNLYAHYFPDSELFATQAGIGYNF